MKKFLTLTLILLSGTPLLGIEEKSVNNSKLFEAIRAGDTTKAAQLINAGTDINSREFDEASKRNYLKQQVGDDEEKLKQLSKQMSNRTPVHMAVARDNIEMVQLLLDNGADITLPDENGWWNTPLAEAISRKNIDMVQLLLDNGATINIQNKHGKQLLKTTSDGIKAVLITYTSPEELEKLALPFFMSLKRRRKLKTLPRVPKDMRNLLIQYIVTEDKLQKVKKYLPNYDENKLRALIEKGVIRDLRRKP